MAATLTRGLSGLLRPLSVFGRECLSPAVRLAQSPRFSTVLPNHAFRTLTPAHTTAPVQLTGLLSRVTPLMPSLLLQPVRNLTYFSLRKGKRKSVKSVTERFFRLHSGQWIRRKAGYKKKLWKKSAARRKRLREHVFCNKTQCKLLDKMTSPYWKRRNWYLNDPYQKYHDRTNLKL
ncbi:large ribosomal subunit protein bL35m [Danio rerio]|uniref:Large ribosomal subunit protein bL35m n=1 Tax=Danio rerio TaxID=7955 RepID=Q0D286_DANRE|nr:39S ribosomal protein L35, mitochondrial [Danio rerio]AAI22375.1 Mitochondrial ribosomal protein L35 [Danio rerio]|eukprot:NP_001070193.1 39S ribosomal protein L35, mitochondrial [Danio rerio]